MEAETDKVVEKDYLNLLDILDEIGEEEEINCFNGLDLFV